MSSETPRIGDYEVLNLLGAGGMGRVYKVRNVITDRIEAMKILLPEIAGKEEVAARFLREIKVLAALNHPNIASLHTAVTIDNQLVMIMEFVEGQPLSAVLARGPVPPAEALSYVDQVLDALSFAHQRKVIHRDIKPANMMLCVDGTVKLMDFGIARTDDAASALTAPGSTLGSMNYMSPEQICGDHCDERSDLYSLGISLYELVTAARPFQGDTSYSLMEAQIKQAPRPPIELQPDMPPGLNQIILTSIEKDPAARFQSADAFRNAVKSVLRELQESKTVIQGSRDETSGSRTPLPQARTGPITRPKPAAASAAPLATRIGAVPMAPAPVTGSRTPVPVAPAPPPAATVFAPPPVAAAPASVIASSAAQKSGNRGLYIAIGAVAVLVVLMVAAIYVPKSRKAAAAPENTPPVQQTQPTQPTRPVQQTASATAAVAATAPAATPPVAATNPPASPAQKVAPKKQASRLMAQNTATPLQAADSNASANAAAEKAKAAELDQLEHDIDQLSSRAAAVNSSLENLKRQQAASGFGLRGDMAQKQATMNLNLSKAQDAVGKNDLERAKRYAALVTPDLEALEKFLGR